MPFIKEKLHVVLRTIEIVNIHKFILGFKNAPAVKRIDPKMFKR